MRVLDVRLEQFGIVRKIPAVVAGELVFGVGHKRALVQRQAPGGQVAHEMHQVLQRIAFNIELALRPVFHQRRQFIDIVGADMALVGPGMHRDALRTGLQAQLGSAQHAGNIERAGVAKQRHLVDIDRQRRLLRAGWMRGVGPMVGMKQSNHGEINL